MRLTSVVDIEKGVTMNAGRKVNYRFLATWRPFNNLRVTLGYVGLRKDTPAYRSDTESRTWLCD